MTLLAKVTSGEVLLIVQLQRPRSIRVTGKQCDKGTKIELHSLEVVYVYPDYGMSNAFIFLTSRISHTFNKFLKLAIDTAR